MTAKPVPQPAWKWPLVGPTGIASRWAQDHFQAMYERAGAQSDKVDAAHAMATAAVPRGTQVVAAGGLKQGGALGGNVGLALYAAIDTVAVVTALTGAAVGDWAYCLNGRKPAEGAGAGTGVPVFWDGAGWISACSGTAVAA